MCAHAFGQELLLWAQILQQISSVCPCTSWFNFCVVTEVMAVWGLLFPHYPRLWTLGAWDSGFGTRQDWSLNASLNLAKVSSFTVSTCLVPKASAWQSQAWQSLRWSRLPHQNCPAPLSRAVRPDLCGGWQRGEPLPEPVRAARGPRWPPRRAGIPSAASEALPRSRRPLYWGRAEQEPIARRRGLVG